MNQETRQDLRQILGKFLTGVTVVTTIDQHGVPVGFTANSFASVSLEPPLVLVCLAKTAGLAPVFRRAESFAINILSTEQARLSDRFARKDEDRFDTVIWTAKKTGSPIIDECCAWLDCQMYEKMIAGDHVILVGKVKDAYKSAFNPLGYYQGRYCAIDLPEDTLQQIEHRDSIHATTGLLIEHKNKILVIKDHDGGYDVPRVEPHKNGVEAGINSVMNRFEIKIYHKTLFSVVEGRHHQRLSIYYRCNVELDYPLPSKAQFFDIDNIPFQKLIRPDLQHILRRYQSEKEAGQFGIYVGDEQQGHIENIIDTKI